MSLPHYSNRYRRRRRKPRYYWVPEPQAEELGFDDMTLEKSIEYAKYLREQMRPSRRPRNYKKEMYD